MIKIKVNVEEAIKALEQSGKDAEKAVKLALTRSAFIVQNEVKSSIAGQRSEPTSVDTGRFLNSVDVEVDKNSASVFTDIDYAKFLEFGTSKLQPRAHFQNSAMRAKNQVQEVFNEEIKDAI